MTSSEESAGRLRRTDTAPPDGALRDVSTERLARELLSRVDGEQLGVTSRQTTHALALLESSLDGLLESHDNRFSRLYARNLFGMFRVWHGVPLPELRGLRCVELGCGSLHPLVTLLLYVLLGAERGVGIDLDPVQDEALAARGLARTIAWMLLDPAPIVERHPGAEPATVLANLARSGVDVRRLQDGDLAGALDGSALALRHASADATGLDPASVDFVHSNSFLEHVADPHAVVRESARIVRPGGHAVHHIDGIDHWHYGEPDCHPLEFLRAPAREPLVHDSNRLRPLRFREVFEEHGFDVLLERAKDRVEVTPEDRATFVEPFRSEAQDVLECVSALYVLRRRPD